MVIEQYVKMPHDRIGVIIGKKGKTKELLEKMTSSKIDVNSEDGTVTIRCPDAVVALRLVEVVKAISRGFSPEKALELLKDDFMMIDIINLSDLSDKALVRIRGRIIGRKGRTRTLIEEMTGTKISVYGKTVTIMGHLDQAKVAREAIEMLINGAPHRAVYSFMEKKRRELKDKIDGF